MSIKIIRAQEIRAILEKADIESLEASIEEGFAAFSRGTATIPLPAHLDFPDGDLHIKYGMIDGAPHFVIKVATGFYNNPKIGLPSGDGYMAIHSQETGRLQAILLDEGLLTDIRTALAGRIAAKYFAPRQRGKIGVIGTGAQARLQLTYLGERFREWPVVVWGRSREAAERFAGEMGERGYDVSVAPTVAAVAEESTLIVTTTTTKTPLIESSMVRPGTHITAVGADGSGKNEIAPSVFQIATRRIVDSVGQCTKFGDSHFALEAGAIQQSDLVELGRVIAEPNLHARSNDSEITIADLTGLAVQDIKIAMWVYSRAIGN